jgi:arginine repressor
MQFLYGDLVQVQETNARMVRELEAVGVRPDKKHRVYSRSLVCAVL